MAKGKRILTGEQVKVKVYSSDEDIAIVVNKRQFAEAYDWTSNTDPLDIVPRYVIDQMIADAGGSTALTFTEEVDSDGNVDLSGKTGMPIAGTIPSALRVFSEDVDYSQSASYTPSSQIVFVGLEENTEVTIKITF